MHPEKMALDGQHRPYQPRSRNHERLPVFMGTRVPIKTLFDWLAGGEPPSKFLENFDSVSQEQAVAVLDLCKTLLIVEGNKDSVRR